MSRPLRERWWIRPVQDPPCSTRWRASYVFSGLPGNSSTMSRPMASCAVHSYSSAAPRFQNRTRPSVSVSMVASAAFSSSMACSRSFSSVCMRAVMSRSSRGTPSRRRFSSSTGTAVLSS